eukprot:1088161-Lingulodinium_polyedra.AAC.1
MSRITNTLRYPLTPTMYSPLRGNVIGRQMLAPTLSFDLKGAPSPRYSGEFAPLTRRAKWVFRET